jgi:coenzyme F420-dependent glucose-6-phosphate dehydrogenase
MVTLGYKLSSEEFGPADLVRFAVRAEQAGFAFGLISDHFHPWTDRQGQSPFVWTTIGAIAQATTTLRLGTAVTCPTMRVHPAIVAQAAATAASLMGGRFFLGLGTGENLNEHVVGRGWPSPDVRLEMLEEAIRVIRLLWQGGVKSHRGRHYTVEDARLYTLPESPPDLMVAASKPHAAEVAARLGDAMINVEVDRELIRRFEHAGGSRDAAKYVELSVCWAKDEKQARKTAHEVWALAALGGPLFNELKQPSHFECAFEPISEDMVAEVVTCGPDPRRFLDAIEKAHRAGYTHVCLHQIGPEQQQFIEFAERELLPVLEASDEPRRNPSAGIRPPSHDHHVARA